MPVPPEPKVRLAWASDAPALGILLDEFNREFEEATPGPDRLAARMRQLLAEGDTAAFLPGSGPHGLAVIRFRPSIWTPRLECYLAELYVAPAHRGRGLGRALLRAAMDHARERGADYIDLTTGADDVAARALYESCGFSNHGNNPEGAIQYYYEREL